MGADYYAKAIIGIALPSDEGIPRATIKTRKKAFPHKFEDDGETEFDPKDGRKLWLDELETTTADYPVFVFDVHDELDEDELEEGQKLIRFPEGIEYAHGTDRDSYFVGCVVETGSSNGGEELGFSKLPNIEHLKETLKGILQPMGYWSDGSFGLYSVLYCSY